MSPVRVNGSESGGKAASFSPPEGAVLYKRRKRDRTGKTVSEPEQTVKVPHDTVHCIGGYELHEQARIVHHWRNALECIVQSTNMREDGGIRSCIQRALASGPLGFSSKLSTGSVQIKDSFKDHQKDQSEAQIHNTYTALCDPLNVANKINKATLHASHKATSDQANVGAITMKCRNVIFDVLVSEKLALLCNFLCENFQGSKINSIIDFSSINSKMESGIYEQSSVIFAQDIHLVWRKFQEIGQEMDRLASSLSNISQASYQRHVGGGSGNESCELKHEDTNPIGTEEKSCSTRVTSHESNSSTKSAQTDLSCLQKVGTCKQCGTKADSKGSLICDGCEGMYHIPCIKPAVQDIPTRSWYCAVCSLNNIEGVKPDITTIQQDFIRKVGTCKQCGTKADSKGSLICDGCEGIYHVPCIKPAVQEIPTRNWFCAACSLNKRDAMDPDLISSPQDCLHQNCVVCERHKGSFDQGKPKEMIAVNSSRECSISSIEDNESPEPSRTALLRLCKQCGTCEDEEKRFLICSNSHCLYKYYHIRCLKSAQLGIHLQPTNCWYCPSCLCRVCLIDRDDGLICMCDGCDEAYHTYCMDPPRRTIPKGMWYCLTCNLERARKGMRRYEQWVLQQHGKVDAKLARGGKKSMAEKLTTKESGRSG